MTANLAERANDRIRELEAEKLALRTSLIVVLGWIPGRSAWHTDEPAKDVERAREVLELTK